MMVLGLMSAGEQCEIVKPALLSYGEDLETAVEFLKGALKKSHPRLEDMLPSDRPGVNGNVWR